MILDKNYVVYEHYTPDTNEIFYVGEGRPDRPYSTRNRNRFWRFKVKKHGGFVVKIVESNITKVEAEQLELSLLVKYKESGTNLTNLCEGTMFGSHWLAGKPKELHPMYGTSRKNPILAEWNREHCGTLSPTFGKKRPDLAERNRNGEFKRFTKKVICVETSTIYNSVKEACESLGKSPKSSAISKCLSGYRPTAFGYHWAYYQD